MDKLKMHSADKVNEHIEQIAALFPNCKTEVIKGHREDGSPIIEYAIDFDVLRQELSDVVVEGPAERYQFTWPEKRKSILAANAPIAKTLRPCREESVDFDTTENLYIEGDNLDVLKLLQETYLGKIKMIYIDPPYNTGNDFVYDDDFAESAEEYMDRSGDFDEEGNRLFKNTDSNGRFHTDWLNMIYPRLKLAKDLLHSQGVLAISIGYQEVNNLMAICKNIFGNRQVISVTVQTSGGKPNSGFNVTHEYIVFVAPTDFTPIPSEEDMKSYGSPYHGMNLATFNQAQRPNQTYPIYIDSEGCIVGCGKSLQERIDSGIYKGALVDFTFDYSEAPQGSVCVWPVTAKGDPCVWRLIPSRLLSDWNKGYIKVVKQDIEGTKNKYSIQYLSGGVISKIEVGELRCLRSVDNPRIPTLEVEEYKTAGTGIPTILTDKQFYTTKGSNEIRDILGKKYFSYPKPLGLVRYILKRIVLKNDYILDFFSGSATTAHAVMQLNAKDGGNRKFIMVQLPEETDETSEAHKAGYQNICEIGKERIRQAGKKVKDENPLTAQNLDIGFRVLKVDSTNMQDIYYNPAEIQQTSLLNLADNIKPDRTPEDLLFQVMLDLGVLLSSKIEETVIGGKTVFSVADGYLLACFDSEVTDEVVTAIAKQKPYYFVMRDSSLASDSVATNFEQIFTTYSPATVRKVL